MISLLSLDDVGIDDESCSEKDSGCFGRTTLLNAEQDQWCGARSSCWLQAVAKGSLKNKIIIVPLAFLFRDGAMGDHPY